jgi:hypothetical protein
MSIVEWLERWEIPNSTAGESALFVFNIVDIGVVYIVFFFGKKNYAFDKFGLRLGPIFKIPLGIVVVCCLLTVTLWHITTIGPKALVGIHRLQPSNP